MSLFRKKTLSSLLAQAADSEKSLKRTLGAGNLIALGIGAIIGAGLFVRTAAAAGGNAGSAVTISFIIAAIGCAFAGLCYAEFASIIPIAGSAYTYAYATMGEIIAWIIGWALILEYAVSNMAVAVGFSAYFNDILENLFGWHLPAKFSGPIFASSGPTGAWFNVPSLVILLILSYIPVRGVKESASTNNVMVLIKIAAIMIFVFG